MDDDYRLIKLISLVGWTDPAENKCGLRFASDAERDRLTEDEQTAGHLMCAHYAGAVQYHQGDTREVLDRQQLPDCALEFVSNLSDGAVALVGEMVGRSLFLSPRTNLGVVGKQWVEDVTATSWRLKLANYQDRFGLTE